MGGPVNVTGDLNLIEGNVDEIAALFSCASAEFRKFQAEIEAEIEERKKNGVKKEFEVKKFTRWDHR